MPLPTTYKRPSIPYIPEQVLANYNRYASLNDKPPTPAQLDGDFNALVDYINQLAEAINETAAGIIPGANDPRNANKTPTTDGRGNVSWTLITGPNIADQALSTRHLQDQAITSQKIQVNAVGTNQISQGAITAPKLAPSSVQTEALNDRAVTGAKIALGTLLTENLADSSITTPKLGDGSVITAKLANTAVSTEKIADGGVTSPKIAPSGVITDRLADLAVTNPKVGLKAVQARNIDAQVAARGSVLLTTGNGNTSFAKVASASFDASLLSRGTVLGSLDGNTLAPVGGLIFAGFYVISASEDGSNFRWKGFNVQNATCVPDFDFGSLTFSVTYRRQATVGSVFAFASYNTLNLTANATGFGYQTVMNSPVSFVYFAFLPDGN